MLAQRDRAVLKILSSELIRQVSRKPRSSRIHQLESETGRYVSPKRIEDIWKLEGGDAREKASGASVEPHGEYPRRSMTL